MVRSWFDHGISERSENRKFTIIYRKVYDILTEHIRSLKVNNPFILKLYDHIAESERSNRLIHELSLGSNHTIFD